MEWHFSLVYSLMHFPLRYDVKISHLTSLHLFLCVSNYDDVMKLLSTLQGSFKIKEFKYVKITRCAESTV